MPRPVGARGDETRGPSPARPRRSRAGARSGSGAAASVGAGLQLDELVAPVSVTQRRSPSIASRRASRERDPPGDLQARLGLVDEQLAAAGVGDVDPASAPATTCVGPRPACARPGPGACAGRRARPCRPGRRRRRPGRRRPRPRPAGCRPARMRMRRPSRTSEIVEPRSSAVKMRPSLPAVASCGCLPTGVARSPPPGSETSTSSFAGSDGTSTGPPARRAGGAAAARAAGRACARPRRGRAGRARRGR